MNQHISHPTGLSTSFNVTTQASRPIQGLSNAIRLIIEALREGPAAHQTYEHLKSHGVPHEAALRQALGVPPSGD